MILKLMLFRYCIMLVTSTDGCCPSIASSVGDPGRWRFLSISKSGHSNSTCFTVSLSPQRGHSGGSSLAKRYEWVEWVCPIRSLQRETSSRLQPALLDCHGPKLGFISLNFLPLGSPSHCRCQSSVRWFLTRGNKSKDGILTPGRGALLAASLANVSAFSFPAMPTWLGTQARVTNLFRQCARWSFCLMRSNRYEDAVWNWKQDRACRDERESVKITHRSFLHCKTWSKQRNMA